MTRLAPDELLKEALNVPEPEPYIPLAEYGEAIQHLYEVKGMTYSKIAEWFTQYGLDYSLCSISNALKEWKYKKALEATK